MTTLHARTNAEAHLYMDQQPCPCGAREFERRSAVLTEGDALCCRYAGPCQGCGRRREFVFELAETIRPVAERIEYGGSDPSRLLDPGEWMDIADAHARRQPGTPRDLALLAIAAADLTSTASTTSTFAPLVIACSACCCCWAASCSALA